jgi:hypothetical protein
MERGDQPLAMIAGDGPLVVYATLEQRESALFGNGEQPIAEVRLIGASDRVLNAESIALRPAGQREVRDPMVTHIGGGDLQMDPSDQTGRKTLGQHFELEVRLPQMPDDFVPVTGQRAVVRVTLGDRSLAWQWGRRIRQVILNASQAGPNAQQ